MYLPTAPILGYFLAFGYLQLCSGDTSRLMSFLLNSQYRNDIRPVKNNNKLIEVDIQIQLYIIREMDSKTQTFRANAWVQFSWMDDFLVWHPANFTNINDIPIPSSKIWTPDIILYNSIDEDRTAVEVFPETLATVKNDGRVYWSMPVLLRTNCKFKAANYPFDKQTCLLEFGSWNHGVNEMKISTSTKTERPDTTRISENGEWQLRNIESKTTEINKINDANGKSIKVPVLVYSIELSRLPDFYLFHLTLPSVMLMIVGVLVFLVPSESGEKISLASTVLLSMTVFMLFIMEHIPPTSEVISLFAYFFGGTMLLLTLATYASVFVLYAHFRGTMGFRPPKILRVVFFEYIGPHLCEKHLECVKTTLYDYNVNKDIGPDTDRSRYIENNQNERMILLPQDKATALNAKHVETLRLIGNVFGKKDTKDKNILSILPGVNDILGANKKDQKLNSNTSNIIELMILDDIFFTLLSINDELQFYRSYQSQEDAKTKLITSEWRAIANIADRMSLILFFVLNIVLILAIVLNQSDEAPNKYDIGQIFE